jgi:TonB family protein
VPRIPAVVLSAAALLVPALCFSADAAPTEDGQLPKAPIEAPVQKQVGRNPEPLTPIEPEYPALASNAGLDGTVVVAVFVDATGAPLRTAIHSRTPRFLDIFDAPAQRAIMRTRFKPALDPQGQPVAAWVKQPIRFNRSRDSFGRVATCAVDSASHYPPEGRALGAEALVGVLVRIDEWGRPLSNSLAVVGRLPPNARLFDEPAKAAVLAARCRPERSYGRDVPSYLIVEVAFTPVTEAAPSSGAPGQ